MKCGVVECIKCNTLRWFGHSKRMREILMIKRVYKKVLNGVSTTGRSSVKWEYRVMKYGREKSERRMTEMKWKNGNAKVGENGTSWTFPWGNSVRQASDNNGSSCATKQNIGKPLSSYWLDKDDKYLSFVEVNIEGSFVSYVPDSWSSSIWYICDPVTVMVVLTGGSGELWGKGNLSTLHNSGPC